MRGRLVKEAQLIQDPTFFQAKRRQSLLDVATRSTGDEDVLKDQSRHHLSEDKKVYGSRPEQVRKMSFEPSSRSLFQSLDFIQGFDRNQFYRGSIKQGLRDTDKTTHEWIPCQLMADALTRDTLTGVTPGWMLLQKQLRTATAGLVFQPKIVTCRMRADDRSSSQHNLRRPKEFSLRAVERYQGNWRIRKIRSGESLYLLQGHEGCMKPKMDLEQYQGDQYDKDGWLSYGSSEFHNNLLYIFDKYEDLTLMPKNQRERAAWQCQQMLDFMRDLRTLAAYWMWQPSHPFSYFYPFAIPFQGYIGKGKERIKITVNEGSLGDWLQWVEGCRADTLSLMDSIIQTLPTVFAV